MMPIKEAIILAGGLGTRLRNAVPDLPKCMAPVNGHPFVAYVINYLQSQGITHFIFSLGYKSADFTDYLSKFLPEGNYELVVEKEPLGTGGAVRLAVTFAHDQEIVIVNGDSIFKSDLRAQFEFHESHKAICTLALKPMEKFSRYGVVELQSDNRISLFKEKQFFEKGLINGGVYILNKDAFLQEPLAERFSFETDYLQKLYSIRKIYGMVQEGYFIDIGIPEDYLKAQSELTF